MGSEDDRSIPVFDLGIVPYAPVQELQGRLRQAVADRIFPGAILLLEHEPVITLGSRGSTNDLRDSARVERLGIPILPSERGGQATLHAPGQLVSYLVVPVPGRDLRAFVHDLEESLVVLLAGYSVRGQRREGRPGVYVDGGKIASVGLRCHRWVASHGTALNVDVDLSLFDLIVSCGEPGLRQTDLRAVVGLDQELDLMRLDVVKMRYVEAASRVFGWELEPPRELRYNQVEKVLGLAS